jgi:hypothetical protein
MQVVVALICMLEPVMIVYVIVRMLVIVVMMPFIVVLGIVAMKFGLVRMAVEFVDGLLVNVLRTDSRGRLHDRVLDDLALNALAAAAAARVAVTRAAPVRAIFGFFLRLAMGALVGFDQRLTIGDRNLVVVRMNFAEGQKAVTVAAVLDEGRLQGRLDARDFGEINVAA